MQIQDQDANFLTPVGEGQVEKVRSSFINQIVMPLSTTCSYWLKTTVYHGWFSLRLCPQVVLSRANGERAHTSLHD